jgi:hypothetical protein
MDSELFWKFKNKISSFKDREYLFALISYHVAPTIWSDKPSSTMTLGKNERDLRDLWEKYKHSFRRAYGLEYYELRKNSESTTILFYDKERLCQTIYDEENMAYLRDFNYNAHMKLEEVLGILKNRIRYTCPHEMGIFLGFPLEDVREFTENPQRPCVMCGYWKVYHNTEKASERFKCYDKAKSIIMNRILQG